MPSSSGPLVFYCAPLEVSCSRLTMLSFVFGECETPALQRTGTSSYKSRVPLSRGIRTEVGPRWIVQAARAAAELADPEAEEAEGPPAGDAAAALAAEEEDEDAAAAAAAPAAEEDEEAEEEEVIMLQVGVVHA